MEKAGSRFVSGSRRGFTRGSVGSGLVVVLGVGRARKVDGMGGMLALAARQLVGEITWSVVTPLSLCVIGNTVSDWDAVSILGGDLSSTCVTGFGLPV